MSSAAAVTAAPERSSIDPKYTWNLSTIFPDWDTWDEGFRALDEGITRYAAHEGTLAQGGEQLLRVYRDGDTLGQLAYRVYYYAMLQHDEDQRNNEINARKQRVSLLLARWQQSTAWFNPELLQLPVDQVRRWMDELPDLALYRFAIEELFRQQAHVLDRAGERLLSLSGPTGSTASEAYSALSTADARFPTVTLTTGERVQVSYGQYRRLLSTCRAQEDRRAAYEALYDTYGASLNTYATLYNGVMQQEWFTARARGFSSTLEAALFGNAIPPAVVETLIAEGRAGSAPFRRYHALRKRVLGVEHYHVYDSLVPLVASHEQYDYDTVQSWIVDAMAPLGAEYQARVRQAFEQRWIDVFENQGKRSGAYSAPVYGAQPYILMNYNDTLDAVFTTAHELGHSMHTLLAHESQPFVYSDYTIFVAEVPSTLAESLLLDYMLVHARSREERVGLLEHAIDNIVGTFYNQVIFADFELEAHRMVERDEPITADVLSALYARTAQAYWGDILGPDERMPRTWARIPHLFQSPYYVYQYATCFASTARLMRDIGGADPVVRTAAVDRYLSLLRAGGSDHPMRLLQRAGVDLGQPDTVRAVVSQLDALVTQLEAEVA